MFFVLSELLSKVAMRPLTQGAGDSEPGRPCWGGERGVDDLANALSSMRLYLWRRVREPSAAPAALEHPRLPLTHSLHVSVQALFHSFAECSEPGEVRARAVVVEQPPVLFLLSRTRQQERNDFSSQYKKIKSTMPI